MKYTRKFLTVVSIMAIIVISIIAISSNRKKEAADITGSINITSNDNINVINTGENTDLDYNYIANPNKLDQRDMPAAGLILYGDKVNEYMKDAGYKRSVLTITDLDRQSSILKTEMQIDDSAEYLIVEYDYTTNEFQFQLKKP